jgi:small subunit ribosomal protein S18
MADETKAPETKAAESTSAPAATTSASSGAPSAAPAAVATPSTYTPRPPREGGYPRREGSGSGPRREGGGGGGYPRREGSGSSGPRREGSSSGPSAGGRDPRKFFRRKKVCKFCVEKIDSINYKDTSLLRQFVAEHGKITPRRITGVCSPHQRRVTEAIKQARNIALLPFAS